MIIFFLHLGQSFRIVVMLYQKAAQVCCAAHHTLADDAFIRRIGWTPLLLQWSQRLGHKSTWMSWTKWKCRKEAHVPYASWRITWIGMRGEGKHVSIHDCIFLLEPSDVLQQSFPTKIRTCEIMQGGPLPAINGPMSPSLEWRGLTGASFFFRHFKNFPSIQLGKNSSLDRPNLAEVWSIWNWERVRNNWTVSTASIRSVLWITETKLRNRCWFEHVFLLLLVTWKGGLYTFVKECLLKAFARLQWREYSSGPVYISYLMSLAFTCPVQLAGSQVSHLQKQKSKAINK